MESQEPDGSYDADRLRLMVEAAPTAMIVADDRGRVVLSDFGAERSVVPERDELLTTRIEDQLRRSILDTIPFSIIATDPKGRIVTVNPAAEQLLGFGKADLVGTSLTEIDGEWRELGLDGAPSFDSSDGEDRDWSYLHKDGRLIPVNEAIVALRGENDEVNGYLVVAYDITNRIEARERVQFLAGHDALTCLPNRATLLEHLEQVIAARGRGDGQVALVLLDLDHFKRVNDSLGHHIGDELLLQISERLRAWTRRDDLVARLGGDEFVVVFGDVTPGPALTARFEELMTDVLAPVEVLGYDLVVTASVGGAVYPRDGGDPTTLLRHADIAMYRAKAAGRDNLQWFERDMIEENNDKLALSAALRHALGKGDLSVVYQPQVDLTSGEVVGFEALARWTSPTLGPISPDRFIPVAEDGGMISQLGEWVLRTACADIADLTAQLGRPLRLAVNVSPRQLRSKSWLDTVVGALADAGLDPTELELEITEGTLIDDIGDAVAILEAVRELGVKVVVDDFGRGYSSLAYLTRFPIDKLKIDRTFIEAIAGADTDAAIVDAIIVMAHALGMTVVAEGVETAEQEAYLRERGCDEAQGYRYSPGVPRDQVVAATFGVGVV
jgi:diguanylate cyclase (GGDEF)-like protein/PAS domain S-box-containing protein